MTLNLHRNTGEFSAEERNKTNENWSKIEQNSGQLLNEIKDANDDLQQQVDNLVIGSGTSPAEVVQARGNEPVLNARLNKMDTQLSDKASVADVNNAVADISDGTPLFATITAGMTDTTRLYVNTTDGLIYRHNGTSWISTGRVYQATGLNDATVSRAKLAPTFSLNGTIATSTNLNSLLTEGLYFGQANGSYINLPADFNVARSFLLRVEPLSTRFFIQTIIDFTDQKNIWVRRYDNQTATGTTWAAARLADGEVTTPKLGNAAVTRVKIADRFFYNGALSSGDANALLIDGEWVVTALISNLPSGAATSGFFSVKNYNNNSFVVQEYTELTNYNKKYRRVIRPDLSQFNPWVTVSVPEMLNPFEGKSAVFFADSIGEFQNGLYPSTLSSILGMNISNVGIGGTRIAKHENNSQGVFYNEMSMYRLAYYVNTGDFTDLIDAAENLFQASGDDNRPQVALLASIDFNEVDYVFIEQATNDFAATTGIPIGTDSDMTADGSTFKGSYNYAIDQLLSAYPHLQIIPVTPYYRTRYVFGDTNNSDDFPNPSGIFLREFAQAVRDIAKKWHFSFVDLHDKSGINKYTAEVLISSDGLHPANPIGFEHLAAVTAAQFKSIYS